MTRISMQLKPSMLSRLVVLDAVGIECPRGVVGRPEQQTLDGSLRAIEDQEPRLLRALGRAAVLRLDQAQILAKISFLNR